MNKPILLAISLWMVYHVYEAYTHGLDTRPHPGTPHFDTPPAASVIPPLASVNRPRTHIGGLT